MSWTMIQLINQTKCRMRIEENRTKTEIVSRNMLKNQLNAGTQEPIQSNDSQISIYFSKFIDFLFCTKSRNIKLSVIENMR